MAQLPNIGERYRGPDGYVEVVAVDAAFGGGTIKVQPAGGGPTKEVSLGEWRTNYSFAPTTGPGGMQVNDELSAAARRGYEGRVRGEPAPKKPDGAVDPSPPVTERARPK